MGIGAVSLLLDSHVLEWAFNDDPRLSQPARRAIAVEHVGTLYASDITLVELARHVLTEKIFVVGDGLTWLRNAAAHVTVLPVTPDIAWRAADLTWNYTGKPHKDPADRLIVATALAHGFPLATKDSKILELAPRIGLAVVW